MIRGKGWGDAGGEGADALVVARFVAGVVGTAIVDGSAPPAKRHLVSGERLPEAYEKVE